MKSWVGRKTLVFGLGFMLFFGSFGVAFATDSGGAETLEADLTSAVNFSWTLMPATLVFLMQAGFAFLGAELVRSKNTVNYLTKSFMDFAVASLSFLGLRLRAHVRGLGARGRPGRRQFPDRLLRLLPVG